MDRLLREKRTAKEFQERRHKDWDENYTLYRNKVFVNRLTQRQAVNIPLMKETIKTLLSKIDEIPPVEWKEQGGEVEKEIILQEIWNHESDRSNFEGIDIQDKKNVLLYGRSFKKLNLGEQGIDVKVLDIYDVLVDPLTDPLDLETARFVIHQNIYKSLRDIIADERYEQKAKDELKAWLMSSEGIAHSTQTKEQFEKKMERLRAMGVNHDEFPHFAAGDVIVNVTEHFTQEWDAKKKDFVRRVVSYADDRFLLLDGTLKEMMGTEFWPFTTWSEDIETADFWSDGPADLIRTPNKIVNVWFSQLVENRTLRNFQMHWYDATVPNYQPQTYEPGPGKMLPAPGKPSDTIKPVEVNGLDEALTSIDYITKIVERGSAVTAIEKGVGEGQQETLGEVRILVGKAAARTVAMAKFYRRSWKELAMKWYGLMEANDSKVRTLYKSSVKGRIWPLKIFPSDWKSVNGFNAIVQSSSEHESEKIKGIQQFLFLLQQFPQNAALRRIAQKRMFGLVDLSGEEIREIIDEDKKMLEMQEQQAVALDSVQAVQQQATESPLAGVAGRVAAEGEDSALRSKLTEFANLAGGGDQDLTKRLNALSNAV